MFTCLLLLAVYLGCLRLPYYIDPEVGVQIKSLTLYLHGLSPNPNVAVLADPSDLSRYKSSDILWFAPAFPFLQPEPS